MLLVRLRTDCFELQSYVMNAFGDYVLLINDYSTLPTLLPTFSTIHVVNGKVVVHSRRGHDWTHQFGASAQVAKLLNARQAILDGEAVVSPPRRCRFPLRSGANFGKRNSDRLMYQAFDLLVPRRLRHETGGLCGAQAQRSIRCSPRRRCSVLVDYLEGDARSIYEHACAMGIEGIVSKAKDAPYRAGRQESWIKLKCTKSDDFRSSPSWRSSEPSRVASLRSTLVAMKVILLYAGKARAASRWMRCARYASA